MPKLKTSQSLEIIQKYWILFLGFIVIFAAILYFIKVGYDQGLISSLGMVLIGSIASLALFILSVILYRQDIKLFSQILAGIGCGGLYATFAYANFDNFWSDWVTLVLIFITTILICTLSFKFNLKVLTFLGLGAALFAPLLVRASNFHIGVLFIYIFIIDMAILLISYLKRWKILPIVGMVLTFMHYFSYYNVVASPYWVEPFIYILLFFVLFSLGLFLNAKKEGKKMHLLFLILLAVNCVWFIAWMVFLTYTYWLPGFVILLLIGSLTIVYAALLYFLFDQTKEVSGVLFALGVIILLIASLTIDKITSFRGIEHIMRTGVGLLLAIIVLLTTLKLRMKIMLYATVLIWFAVYLQWFINAWNIKNTRWFGLKFTPLINPADLTWIALIILGFIIAAIYRKFDKDKSSKEQKISTKISIIIELLCHLAIGGLLTLDLSSIWYYYSIPLSISMSYSFVWGIYALILFYWGYRNKLAFFIYFSDLVIILVVIKVLFFDISGKGELYRAFIILITGIIISFIGFLNYKYQSKIIYDNKVKEKNKDE